MQTVFRGACVVCIVLLAASAQNTSTDSRHVDQSARWQRTGRNVLWGFTNMYHPTVLQVEDPAYPFRMWFMGWAADDSNSRFPGCDAIFHARGKDLDSWEVYAGDQNWDATMDPKRWVPVITARDKPYDAWHNGDPSVVRKDGRYYMAYSSTGPDEDGLLFGHAGDSDGDLMCVMGAASDDGIHWQRTEKPLLIYEPEIGKAGDPQSDAVLHGMYHRPSLLFDGGRWRLWFDYWTSSGVATGYAEAAEDEFMQSGFRVLRAGDSPVIPEWPNPDIIKLDGKYRAFADPSGYGEGWAGRQLAEAISGDGLNWQMLGWIPPDSDTPACHVPAATVVEQAGSRWLVVFYACQIGGSPEYNYRYDRIRYMKQPIEKTNADFADATWTLVTKEAAFSPRDTAEDVVYDGKMWLSNGWYHNNVLSRDLWVSTDGATWTLVNSATPYDAYSEMVVYDGKMWAIKGSVWASTDGIDWTQVAKETAFGVRGYGEVVVHGGKMWHLGCGADVWWTTDGVNWTCATENAPYGNRAASAVAVYDGKLWLMGGYTQEANEPPEKNYPQFTTHNDVWVSTDGAAWDRVLENAPWMPRMWSIAKPYAGELWLIGGFDNVNGKNFGDVWHTRDGKEWVRLEAKTGFTPRHEPTCYVYNGSLWVVAGNTWPVVNDAWRLTFGGGG